MPFFSSGGDSVPRGIRTSQGFKDEQTTAPQILFPWKRRTACSVVVVLLMPGPLVLM